MFNLTGEKIITIEEMSGGFKEKFEIKEIDMSSAGCSWGCDAGCTAACRRGCKSWSGK